MAPIQVGDAIPSVDLFEGAPDKKVNLAEECASGKHIIFGVPGAFTPTCSEKHFPGYLESIDELKKEVYHLQRELLQERTKVKALSEELENPMNVHRWRKLEGSDPAMFELIQKVRTLQKRLIAKTEEVVAKDLEIQEKERLHKELTGILEKQPGPEVIEQLQAYQETFAQKMKQMQSMQSELKTYQAQVGDYKDEIERLTRELQEVKRKYFDQKKKEQLQQDIQRGDAKAVHPRPQPQ